VHPNFGHKRFDHILQRYSGQTGDKFTSEGVEAIVALKTGAVATPLGLVSRSANFKEYGLH